MLSDIELEKGKSLVCAVILETTGGASIASTQVSNSPLFSPPPSDKILRGFRALYKLYFSKVSSKSILMKLLPAWINELQSNTQTAGETGELFQSESVEEFAETFFKDVSGYKKDIAFSDLLDPKTYFTLKTEFRDEDDNKSPGSTGESYTARVLLGIGRLSITSKEKRNGLNFLILEEVASLDPSNFNTFPELAEQFGYQIITMTPKPFGSNSADGWYLHQLIPGKINKDINSQMPNSSFKTNYSNEQLLAYLERNKN